MKAEKRILITGAGIAGPVCAYWLNKYGFSVVIAEKAGDFRDGGQNIDIKGPGQHVIELMELAEKIEAKNTLERGQKYLDAAGEVIAVLPKGAVGTLTNDFEILRGEFARVLYEATKNDCEYRFGTGITALEENGAGISVSFDNGTVEDFELVICAEGISSSTREKVLGGQTHFRYLGAYMAFFNIPRRPEDDYWAWTVNGIGGTFITLRPGTDTVTTVLMTFLRKDPGISVDEPAARKRLLLDALKGRGTIAGRISAELDTVRDFYFGPMSQVQASTWSKGRFVLLGDAAHCPTPFTGQGTALALAGAYVLAGEIKRGADHAEAFAAYERLLRPYVEATQRQLNPSLVRLAHAKTRFGIAVTRLVQRSLASEMVQRLFKRGAAKRASDTEKEFVLPTYS